MKKLFIIIIILLIIFVAMVIYKKIATKSNVITIEEVQKIEEYISKIYMWKEVTGEALPKFSNPEQANEIWLWEVVNQNLENYEITYEEIEATAKTVFGEEFNKKFPQKGSETIQYNEETKMYYTTGMGLDSQDDIFLLNKIERTKEGYIVEIVEYLEDYESETSIGIKNLDGVEKGRVGINESETKVQEIVKSKINEFSKKKVYLKNNNEKLIVQKVEE